MNRRQFPIVLIAVILLLLCSQAESAISLRAGMVTPLSEFKDLAKTGWSAGVLADVRSLPVGGLTIIVLFNTSHLAQRKYDFTVAGETHTQKSQMTFTGGGIGLRLMPPTPVFKPFAELLGRVSSVQQDFRDNADKASMESKTKLGYEVNAGLRYCVSPGVDLELGGGYTAFSKTKLKHKDTVSEIAPRGWQAFVGVALTIGL
jgi:opacity protein-like surface antigen